MEFLARQHKLDEAIKFAQEAMDVLPDSLFVSFMAAEIYESAKTPDFGKEVFEKLVTRQLARLDAIKSALDAESADDQPNDSDMESVDGGKRTDRLQKDMARLAKDLEMLQGDLNLTWIQYMKFMRRAEVIVPSVGLFVFQGMKGARAVFSRARKAPFCSHHVFVASGNYILLNLLNFLIKFSVDGILLQ
jgi:cleavage stimulation factor subunit 3